ncbi:benzoate/H(+) symporter BenE family transporter [Arthrobacter sp. CAN_A1]|uniref:benzoate/H(+) symporter BenE family transporter n=1 Tax=Arthrobacter sp. CAN_A1 TaxID=2787717 RepID=UPI0018CB0C22
MTPESAATVHSPLREPVLAGVVTALVGFTSSFAVVLAGLRATGATEQQAASGLLALTVIFGLGMILLSTLHRIPITLAWSTPGAALLAGAASYDGGWPAAVGAFVVTGALIVATGAVPALGRLIGRIPTTLAQAMLAGVLLPLCLAPFRALGTIPLLVLPLILVWLVGTRFAPRWAVPLTLAGALLAIGGYLTVNRIPLDWATAAPAVEMTMPEFSLQAVASLALPLYIVTMASQNVPGVAVLASFGYRTPWRSSMLVTGLGTAAAAPFGGHAMNLAALSAALSAGETAGPDRSRRWVAAVSAGCCYLILAGASAALVTVVAAAPPGLIETVAGLALMGTMASALAAALADAGQRLSAIVTFLVAASGLSLAGIGGAFWALIAGLLVRWVVERRPAT